MAREVDCLGLYYGGKLFAYPCLGFFQLNNEGSTGVCEADVDSTLTQLLIRYLTGRPGYVSDPVIDLATLYGLQVLEEDRLVDRSRLA